MTPSSVEQTAAAGVLDASSPVARARAVRIVRTAAAISIGVGILGCLGRAFGLLTLTRVLPGYPEITPVTSVACIILGWALQVLGCERQRIRRIGTARAASTGVLLMGLATMGLYVVGFDGFDGVLGSLRRPMGAQIAGFPAVSTTIALVLLAASIATLDLRFGRGWWPAQWGAFGASSVALGALVAQLYGGTFSESISQYMTMSLHTAVAIIALGVGVVTARPEYGAVGLLVGDGLAATIARRLLPVAVIGPVVSGGLAEAAVRLDLFDEKFALGLMAVASLAVTSVALAGTVRQLLRIETAWTRARRTTDEHRERLRVTLASIGDAVIATDVDGRIVFANPVAAALTGWSSAECVGRDVTEVFRVENEGTRVPVDNPVTHVLSHGRIVGLANDTALVARDGRKIPIDDSAAPIRDGTGRLIGVVMVFRDVSQRRAAQEERDRRVWTEALAVDTARALAQREEALALLDAVFDRAPVGLAFFDTDLRVARVNAAMARLTGLSASAHLEKRVDELIPGIDPAVGVALQNVLESGESIVGLWSHIPPGGSEPARRFQVSCYRVARANGATVGVAVVMDDVTATESAGDAVRRSEARYRSLVEASAQLVWIADPAGPIRLDTSDRAHPMPQMIPTDENWDWLDDVHPEDREATRAAFATMSDVHPTAIETEFRMRRAQGPYRVLHTRAVPVHDADGALLEWVGAATDVTAQRETERTRDELLGIAERARADAERAAMILERLQRVADAALLPLALDEVLEALLQRVCDELEVDAAVFLVRDRERDVLIVRASTGFDEESGRPVEVPFGQGFTGQIAVEQRPIVIEDVAAASEHSPDLRLKAIRSLAGVPLLAEGHLVGVLEVGARRSRRFTDQDVTLLRLAGDRAALAISRGLATEAERLAREQAEETNRAKDEFLAVLSHELRSPLNAMVSWLTILRQKRDDPKTFAKATEVLDRSVRLLTQLVNDLLDVSRIVSGKLALVSTAVDFSKVVTAGVELIQPTVEARGLRIGWNAPPDAMPIQGDPQRLQQVVGNLLNNAVKFTGAGGAIDIDLRRVGSVMRLEVTDSGQGIDAALLPFIFERFRQADYSSGRRHGGLGLGLAIVRHVVERHGGRVTAASRGLGRGATFTVELPLASNAAMPALLEQPVPHAEVEGLRVLLVDDQVDSREAMALGLELSGITVAQAGSTAQAVEACRRDMPDVLVSDIGMPDEDGYSLIRRVRALDQDGALAAIAVTGFASIDDRSAALRHGFDDHIAKPVGVETLVARVRQVAGWRRPLRRRVN